MTLNEIACGETCVLVDLKADGRLAQRLMDLGFYPGAAMRVIRNAPLVDPVEIEIDGTFMTLRHDEARFIEVQP